MRRGSGLALLTIVGCLPAAALRAEVIFVAATASSGVATSAQYYGNVTITVSGLASSPGEQSDAFYRVSNPGLDPGYYQLSFNTSSAISSPTRDVANFVVGALPPYDSVNHTYTVILNTGVSPASPQTLFFGFTDGGYGDNSGGWTVDVSQVPAPEPASIGLLGAAILGIAAARRRNPTA